MSKNNKIHTREDFASDKSYDAYITGVRMGKRINDLMDKGHLVFNEDNKPINDRRFKFSFFDKPTIGLVTKDEHSCLSYGNSSIDGGKVCISKRAIVNGLSQFKIIDLKHIKNIKF